MNEHPDPHPPTPQPPQTCWPALCGWAILPPPDGPSRDRYKDTLWVLVHGPANDRRKELVSGEIIERLGDYNSMGPFPYPASTPRKRLIDWWLQSRGLIQWYDDTPGNISKDSSPIAYESQYWLADHRGINTPDPQAPRLS